MKYTSAFICLILALLTASCAKAPQTGRMNAVVTEMSDTSLVADADGITLNLVLKHTNFPAGPVQPGDSVALTFQDGVAVTVRLLVQPSRVVDLKELNNGGELMTRPKEEPKVPEPDVDEAGSQE